MSEKYAYIKGNMAKDGNEVISIPMAEHFFYKFVEKFEHEKLSDSNCKIDDEKQEIIININNQDVLKEFHRLVNDYDGLIQYIILYLISIDNVEK